jgi:hypothetical protein
VATGFFTEPVRYTVVSKFVSKSDFQKIFDKISGVIPRWTRAEPALLVPPACCSLSLKEEIHEDISLQG